jgi:hypothetical protein
MILADGVQLRTLAMRRYLPTITGLVSASLAMKILLLALETRQKTKYLKPAETQYGPEHTTGVIGRALYLWLNHFL